MKTCSKCYQNLNLDQFYTTMAQCKSCTLLQQKHYYQKNREKVLARVKTYSENNQDKISERNNARKETGYFKDYYEQLSVIERRNAFYKQPTQKIKKASRERQRQATKIHATPPWLTKEHQQKIEDFYWLANDLEKVSGQPYHVDHIIPLRGKDVCGLHVPWNLQILPEDLNCAKGNRL